MCLTSFEFTKCYFLASYYFCYTFRLYLNFKRNHKVYLPRSHIFYTIPNETYPNFPNSKSSLPSPLFLTYLVLKNLHHLMVQHYHHQWPSTCFICNLFKSRYWIALGRPFCYSLYQGPCFSKSANDFLDSYRLWEHFVS